MSSASTLDLQKRLPRQACLSPLTGGVAGGTRGVVPLPSPVKGKGDSRPTVDEVSSTRAETAMAIGPRDQSNEEIARKIDRHALRLGQDDHGSKASLRRRVDARHRRGNRPGTSPRRYPHSLREGWSH
jgi:hypothetical protein